METNNRKAVTMEDLRSFQERFKNAEIPNQKRSVDFGGDQADAAMRIKQECPETDVYINGRKVEGIVSLHYGIPNE
jgi:hypothetical protein